MTLDDDALAAMAAGAYWTSATGCGPMGRGTFGATTVEALAAEVLRLRALPVLRTCGDCGWLSSAMERAHPVCDHPASPDKRAARGRDSAPASWCPLRGAR